jgi:hypothetical protein
MERNQRTMSTNRSPASDGEEFDWRWVGEPESWMGLRSERALAHRPNVATSASEPASGRLAARLARSFLSLFRG